MKITIMASYTFLNYRKHYKISNKICLAVALGENRDRYLFTYIYQSGFHVPLPTVSLLSSNAITELTQGRRGQTCHGRRQGSPSPGTPSCSGGTPAQPTRLLASQKAHCRLAARRTRQLRFTKHEGKMRRNWLSASPG